MSNSNNNRKCPYCKARVGYLTAIINKNQGEYTCKKCKRNSNIIYNNGIYGVILLCALVSIVLGFFVFREKVIGVIMAILPFVVLYLCSPVFFKLVPLKIKPRAPVNRQYEKIDSGRRYNVADDEDVKTYIPQSGGNYNDDADGKTKYIPDLNSKRSDNGDFKGF